MNVARVRAGEQAQLLTQGLEVCAVNFETFLALTDDVDLVRLAPLGLRVDLALVRPGVCPRRRPDRQHPVLRLGQVVDRHPGVRGVADVAHRQDVEVALTDPGDLGGKAQGLWLFDYSCVCLD